MRIALWTMAAAVGLGLVACGGGDNTGSTSSTTTPPTNPTPTVEVPTDFVGFVNQQLVMEPAFGSATPDATSSISMDFALGDAATFGTYTGGDALPAGTYQASAGCSQAGPAKCNPAVSADLNSTLN